MRVFALLALAGCRLNFDLVATDGDATSMIDAERSMIDAPPSVSGPGTWQPTSASPLAPRMWSGVAWTGSEFLIYAGSLDASFAATNTGARYASTTQTWTSLPLSGAPPARHAPHTVWAQNKLLVYGGGSGLAAANGGGVWDPATNTWTVMATNTPSSRIYGAAVAIDRRMFLWGGWTSATGHYNNGFLYDPMTDAWTATSTTNAPTARSLFRMVWTGSRVIVWGGCDGQMGSCPGVKGDGALYDPSTDTWTPMASAGAPSARSDHSLVWTGSEAIVFGGFTGPDMAGPTNTGAIYSPATNQWRPISMVGAPSARGAHVAKWIVDKMIVWGGDAGGNLGDGFLYDPTTDTWTAMAQGPLSPRDRVAAEVGGLDLFVWGGSYSDASGAVWRPTVP